MIHRRMRLIAASFCTLAVSAAYAAGPPQVKTDKGIVAGKWSNDQKIQNFLGIPYAAPPVGRLRWQAPQPAAAWDQPLQATDFGKRCIQSGSYADMIFRDAGESEDCLTLNVWAPADSTARKLPVMVWIYGGGFNTGGTSEARQDGENLAHKGVIVVSMNYRLGIIGFYTHKELASESEQHVSGNYGLLDQVAALKWVKKNIAAFGGNPERVTIFGESAGSSATSSHMSSPISKGLFVRVIGESGSLFKRRELAYPSMEPTQKADEEFAQSALGTSSIAELRALPAQVLVKAALDKDNNAPRFQPVIDGHFFPKNPAAIYASHTQNDVPMLAGWNQDEGTNQVVNSPEKLTLSGLQATAKADFGADAPEFLKLYAATTDKEAERAAEDYASDKFIAYATWMWLDAQAQSGQAPIYRYYFQREQPGDPLHPKKNGTFHSSDIEYVFGNLDSRKGASWKPEDYKLSELMQSYWVNFAKTGNPNGAGLPAWPAYDEKTGWLTMHLDEKPAPKPDQRRGRFVFLRRIWGS